MKLTQLVVLAALLLGHGRVETAPRSLVAPLVDQGSIYGCSWSASSSALGTGYIFLAEPDDSRTLMNIGGKDVELELVEQSGDLLQVGHVQIRKFRALDVEVLGTFETRWVCPPDDESCDVTRFDVEFQVSDGEKRQVFNATGDLGC